MRVISSLMLSVFCASALFLYLSCAEAPMEIEQGVMLAGYVKDAGGQPIQGAKVYTSPTTKEAYSDNEGVYRLSGIASVYYTVYFVKVSYACKAITVNLTTAQTQSVTLLLPGNIQGTVTNTQSQPISGATISTNPATGTVTSGADGTYSLAVEPGNYTVTCSKTLFFSSNKSIAVVEGQNSSANFQLAASLENLVFVEGGTFTMGDTWGDGDSEEKPTHPVTLNSLYITKYEITQKRWRDVMGTSPSYFTGDSLPVEQVSWYNTIDFCNKWSVTEGFTPCYSINGNTNPGSWTSGTIVCNWSSNGYRLPTEAEWEYAARGGKLSAGTKYSGSSSIDAVAWYSANSSNTTHTVGSKQANELGICDMSGNVWEWCWDWYGSYSSGSQTNPTGASSGSDRCLRGGSWHYYTYDCRVAHRSSSYPGDNNNHRGFRVARTY